MRAVSNEKVSCKGVYVFTKAFLETPEQFALQEKITRYRAEGKPYLHLVRELNRICRTEKVIAENIVPTVARTMIANNLTDASVDNLMLIKYAELGSGTTAPANGDTALETSVYRNAIASRTNASNVAYATAFFNATETTGTYRECGIFSDGTASAGTGVLFSRVAINVTKTNTESLTIGWTLTIS